ncbi:chorismate synthase [Streptomyces sp. A7024]|uniref:Chorismate synthase n=1 Tax=Streptomyces coryli TaxID=1128680 RepID=A0A6G4U9Y3_9ACTN|nr:protealysin inhibitor emfourin [Streptomyces coryli]NGN69039.1 chorismate synthase [Streptomyces coryli]
MRISVKRTGGFGGIPRHRTLETAGRADAVGLQALARQAIEAGRQAPPVGVPDGFTYELTVDGRTVYCADPRLTDAQRALITAVMKEGG